MPPEHLFFRRRHHEAPTRRRAPSWQNPYLETRKATRKVVNLASGKLLGPVTTPRSFFPVLARMFHGETDAGKTILLPIQRYPLLMCDRPAAGVTKTESRRRRKLCGHYEMIATVQQAEVARTAT